MGIALGYKSLIKIRSVSHFHVPQSYYLDTTYLYKPFHQLSTMACYLCSTSVSIRAGNKGSRRFHNHGEGPYSLLLVVGLTTG